jgi:prepilin-type N-terminal cleavage/methylation domain-containing protein
MGIKAEHRSSGFTLVEVLVALAIVALIGVAILGSLQLATKSASQDQIRETARNFATAQLEYIKNLPYDSTTPSDQLTYAPANMSTQYPGYSVNVTATRVHPVGSTDPNDEGVQKITLAVTHSGSGVITLEGFKANYQ